MKILYIIYQVCFALPILLVLTILTALVTIIGSLIGGAHIWGYYPGKIWSQLICYILLIPVEVHGREKIHKRTSYVFVPNHQGAFDIFLIYGFLGRNFKWMMKKSLRKIPFVGKACESAGHIFVDRSSPKKVLATMRQAESSLKDGVSLVVFPEGARTFTGHMGYFKRGAFQLADELQLEVVPVTIDGSFEILPRTGKWIHRHRMILTIHEPIPPKGKGAENIKASMNEAYAAVESALPEKYKGLVKNEDQDRETHHDKRQCQNILLGYSGIPVCHYQLIPVYFCPPTEAFCFMRFCSSISCMFSFAFVRKSFTKVFSLKDKGAVLMMSSICGVITG